jgi:exonuclease III
MGIEKALIWNVQGLNARQHRDTVHDLVVMEHPSLVCLQEIKLDVISYFDLMQMLARALSMLFSLLSIHGVASWSCGKVHSGWVLVLLLGCSLCWSGSSTLHGGWNGG